MKLKMTTTFFCDVMSISEEKSDGMAFFVCVRYDTQLWRFDF
jgi:hypothetical protein